MFKLSKNSLTKLEGVHPKLAELCYEAIKETPIDFAIVQGVRSKEYQEALYAQGRKSLNETNFLRSKAQLAPITAKENEMVVTWTLKSNHIRKSDGYGHAIDVAAYVDGKLTWDTNYYAPIINTFKSVAKRKGIKITCGIDWTPRDWGHVELN